MTQSAIAEALTAQCEKMRADPERHRDRFRVLQLVATPTLTDPVETAAAWSVVCHAKRHNAAMLDRPELGEWMDCMPILMFDSVTTAGGDFNRRVNETVSRFNRALVDGLLSEASAA